MWNLKQIIEFKTLRRENQGKVGKVPFPRTEDEANSGQSFLALWNRPKFFLQTRGKPAIHLQALDRQLKAPCLFLIFMTSRRGYILTFHRHIPLIEF